MYAIRTLLTPQIVPDPAEADCGTASAAPIDVENPRDDIALGDRTKEAAVVARVAVVAE